MHICKYVNHNDDDDDNEYMYSIANNIIFNIISTFLTFIHLLTISKSKFKKGFFLFEISINYESGKIHKIYIKL